MAATVESPSSGESSPKPRFKAKDKPKKKEVTTGAAQQAYSQPLVIEAQPKRLLRWRGRSVITQDSEGTDRYMYDSPDYKLSIDTGSTVDTRVANATAVVIDGMVFTPLNSKVDNVALRRRELFDTAKQQGNEHHMRHLGYLGTLETVAAQANI